MTTLRYQRLYDRLAPYYAGAMRLLPVWRGYTETVLPWLDEVPASGTILEIGPGPGVLLTQLAQRFRVAVGIDLSTGMLIRAQSRLQNAGLSRRLVQGDAVHLPFPANTFDAIILTFTFSAIPDGLGAMQEMARVLRHAGPGRESQGGLLALVDAGMPDDGNPMGVGLAHLWEQFDDFMREEADLMRQAGLHVLERRQFGAFSGIRLVVGRKTTRCAAS
jgi:ubiquinone/menaquinone biosynthesis C-methylase UbiE